MKKIIVNIVLIFAIVIVSGCSVIGSDEDKFNDKYNKAEYYAADWREEREDDKIFQKAIDTFNEAIKIYEGKDTEEAKKSLSIVYNNIGVMYDDKWSETGTKEYLDTALENYTKAYEYDKTGGILSGNLASIYIDLWEEDKSKMEYIELAEKYADASIQEVEVDDAETYNLIGYAYIGVWEGKNFDDAYFNKAEEVLKLSLELDSEDEQAVDNLMYLYYTKWERDQSKTEYKDKYEELKTKYNR